METRRFALDRSAMLDDEYVMAIHPTALVDPSAKIGTNVEIGAFSIVYGNVEIGAGAVVESHCILGLAAGSSDGEPLSIGAQSLIRSHSIFYAGSRFGEGLHTGHHVTVRDGTVAGPGLQIGSNGDIQGDCIIGEHTRLQSDVAIGRGSRIGAYVWLFPRVSLLNDPTPPSDTLLGPCLDDFAVICAHSAILPGIRVGTGAVVGAGTICDRSVMADRIVSGSPMRDRGATSRIRLKGSRLPAYPWTRHFHRGYPAEIVAQWIEDTIRIAA